VDYLHRVSLKYSLLYNVDKAKVMASDGILNQNEQLEQVHTCTFPYLGSLVARDGECIYDGIPNQVKQRKYGKVTT